MLPYWTGISIQHLESDVPGRSENLGASTRSGNSGNPEIKNIRINIDTRMKTRFQRNVVFQSCIWQDPCWLGTVRDCFFSEKSPNIFPESV